MSALKATEVHTGNENHDKLVQNLKLLMYKLNINEAELCRRTDIPQPTIHKILSGKTTDPRISTLKILANYFEISVDALYSNKLSQIENQSPQGQSIPIISWEDCIRDNDPIKNLRPNNWDQWVIIEESDNKEAYALVTKPSMEPRFPRGSLLIAAPQIRPSDGDLVIVQYPDTNEATLRELSIDGPNKLLYPINQNSEPDKLDNTVKIIATVTQSRFSY